MSERADDSDAGDRDASERIAAAGPSGGVDDAPELDEFLSLLSERRRRDALYWLRDRDAGTVDALAERIVAERTGETPADIDETERERIRTKLVHVDIPTLAAAGLVSYDRRTGTLRFDYPPQAVDALLEACARLEGIDSSADEDPIGVQSDGPN